MSSTETTSETPPAHLRTTAGTRFVASGRCGWMRRLWSHVPAVGGVSVVLRRLVTAWRASVRITAHDLSAQKEVKRLAKNG